MKHPGKHRRMSRGEKHFTMIRMIETGAFQHKPLIVTDPNTGEYVKTLPLYRDMLNKKEKALFISAKRKAEKRKILT
jgi:hypothetical protein